MKSMMIIAFLAFVAPAMAAEIDAKTNPDRHVADDLEIAMLPHGEIVPRLVSRSGRTARQFWVNSVYPPQGVLVVFEGKGRAAQSRLDSHDEAKGERRIPVPVQTAQARQ